MANGRAWVRLIARVPSARRPERTWVLGLVARWLGIEIEEVVDPAADARPGDTAWTGLRLAGTDDDRELALPEVLFATPDDAWLTPDSAPTRPLAAILVPPTTADASPPPLPVLFGVAHGDVRPWITQGSRLALTVDVLGGMFWLLARCEELLATASDRHGRFPVAASLAFAEGIVERPLGDEYVALLGAAIRVRWPEVEPSVEAAPFQLRLTHDIDNPFAAWGRSAKSVVRSVAGDIVRRRDPGLAAARATAWLDLRSGRVDRDPLATFDALMDVSESHGLRSQFYFLSGTDRSVQDFRYQLSDAPFPPILRRIHDRGHGIGLHAGYMTFDQPKQMAAEFAALKAACASAGIRRDGWGVRQHYLRWRWPETARIHESLSLHHDSSVAFTEASGFRTGTCREYPLFDPVARRQMALVERPLVVMDTTLFESEGLDFAAAATRIRDLFATCRRTGGEAVLLVHNDTVAGRELGWYRELVAGLVR